MYTCMYDRVLKTVRNVGCRQRNITLELCSLKHCEPLCIKECTKSPKHRTITKTQGQIYKVAWAILSHYSASLLQIGTHIKVLSDILLWESWQPFYSQPHHYHLNISGMRHRKEKGTWGCALCLLFLCETSLNYWDRSRLLEILTDLRGLMFARNLAAVNQPSQVRDVGAGRGKEESWSSWVDLYMCVWLSPWEKKKAEDIAFWWPPTASSSLAVDNEQSGLSVDD